MTKEDERSYRHVLYLLIVSLVFNRCYRIRMKLAEVELKFRFRFAKRLKMDLITCKIMGEMTTTCQIFQNNNKYPYRTCYSPLRMMTVVFHIGATKSASNHLHYRQ